MSEHEEEMIASLLADITPTLSRDQDAEDQLTSAVFRAYLHRPTRDLLKALWDRLKSTSSGPEFVRIVEELSERAVPESLSLAVAFAQRAYALTTLFKMQHEGHEPDLQDLIERFPWILEPSMEKLTANQQLKTVTMRAAEEGLTPSRVTGGADINPQYKPDFVFLDNQGELSEIVVVEIKSPREDLTFANREQLFSYLTYLEQQYGSAKLSGILVGTNGMNLDAKRSDVVIKGWDQIFRESRRGHVELLAAMLAAASPDRNDDRVRQVREFGGSEVWELLHRVASNDMSLQKLLGAPTPTLSIAGPSHD